MNRSLRALALLAGFGLAPVLRGQLGVLDLKPGFPVTRTGTGSLRGGNPVVASLGTTYDALGRKSIIFGTQTHDLWVIGYDGSTQIHVTLPSEITSSPAVADITGDGKPDIVVAYGSTYENNINPGGVRAFRNNGTQLWDRPGGMDTGTTIPAPVVSSPAIADLDGDGKPEVVWGGFDGKVYVVDGATGVDKPGWPKFLRDSIFSSPALFDLDGDGTLEIIIGVDAHVEGGFPYPNGGCLHVFNYAGTERLGFPFCIDSGVTGTVPGLSTPFESSPAIGDINGDGKPEIVFGTGHWANGATPIGPHKVYAVKCDGSLAAGWPVNVDGRVWTTPAIADLDGDGVPEVVVTDDNTGASGKYHVYAFKGGGGSPFWQTIPLDYFNVNLSAENPMIADVLGDSKPEVLVPTNSEICILSNLGVQLTYNNVTHLPVGGLSFKTETALHNSVVTDFESDGNKIEVVAVSGTPFPGGANTEIFVWNPKAPTLPVPWGQFHQNETHLGVVPGTPRCTGAQGPVKLTPLAPCRVVDTRNADGPLGGPILGPGVSRTFALAAGTCGVPTNAIAVSANIGVTGNTGSGEVKVFPGDQSAPVSTTIAFPANRTRANNGVFRLSSDGRGAVSVLNNSAGNTHVFIDVNGYFR